MAFVTSTWLTKANFNVDNSFVSRDRSFSRAAVSRSRRRAQCIPMASKEDMPTAGDDVEAVATSLEKTPFPSLYDAWFAPSLQLSMQAREAVTRAHASGVQAMELQWPVVPNLEEIAAGTLLNFEFGKQAARDLGMAADADYQLVKRYLASFCNLWWCTQIAQAPPFRERAVWAVSTDGVSKMPAQGGLPDNVRLASLRNRPDGIASGDVVVIMDPRFDDAWRRGLAWRPKDGTVIFLNSQFNESYGLTGPRRGKLAETKAVYFLKRVTRGYVFYSYPGPWRACLENPDYSIEELATFDEEPKLRTIANVVREESNKRYGGFNNDRYVRGFGGRL